MSKKHLSIIESIAADGKRAQALFLLDYLDMESLGESEQLDAADLKARICVQQGEYEKAKDIWDQVLKKDETHVGAARGISLLEKRDKNKLFAGRIGLARLVSDHGRLLGGIIVLVLILIWFYSLHVNVRDIQISNSPGGGFYTIFENRVEDISHQNERLNNAVKEMQNAVLNSQKTQKDQILLKLAEYCARFQTSEKKFQAQISQLEEKLEKSIHDISLLIDDQAKKAKRDAEQGLRITQVQKNMDKIVQGMDGLVQDVTAGITKQQEIDKDLNAVAAGISALKAQGDNLSEILTGLQRQIEQNNVTAVKK